MYHLPRFSHDNVDGQRGSERCPVSSPDLHRSPPCLQPQAMRTTMSPHAHGTHPWQSSLQVTRSFITAPCSPALFVLCCCCLFRRLGWNHIKLWTSWSSQLMSRGVHRGMTGQTYNRQKIMQEKESKVAPSDCTILHSLQRDFTLIECLPD